MEGFLITMLALTVSGLIPAIYLWLSHNAWHYTFYALVAGVGLTGIQIATVLFYGFDQSMVLYLPFIMIALNAFVLMYIGLVMIEDLIKRLEIHGRKIEKKTYIKTMKAVSDDRGTARRTGVSGATG